MGLWYDRLEPGVYIDRDGNVWERRGQGEGRWYLNGVLWTPFPDSVRLLDEGFVKEHMGVHETLQETRIRLERQMSRDPEEYREPEEDDERPL